MNETILRFGYPDTLIAEYEYWLVLLRPAQPTLGSLVLAAKGEATAYADLSAEAFAEQAGVVADIEAALSRTIGYAKINYLMLMMVDPHVHFHVIPRYEETREFEGVAFSDSGWPKLPALGEAVTLDAARTARLVAFLRAHWSPLPPRPLSG